MKKKVSIIVVAILVIAAVFFGGYYYGMRLPNTPQSTKTTKAPDTSKIKAPMAKAGEQVTYEISPWTLDDGSSIMLEAHKINRDKYGHEFDCRFLIVDDKAPNKVSIKEVFTDKISVQKIQPNTKATLITDGVLLTIYVPDPSWVKVVDDSNK